LDVTLQAAFIVIASSAAGYWITTFYIQPILRYRNIRNKVLRDFIYYAQVINADGLNEDMQKLYRERVLANRDASVNLRAAIMELPKWYLSYLKKRGQNPEKAARDLIGFSNTRKYEQSHKLESNIRKNLGLPSET
jgi:hypothetical protein